MLILKIYDERERVKKVKGFFRKKIFYEKPEDIKRYSITINGKTVIVLELPEDKLSNEEILTLLKVYKGKVLVSKKICGNEFLDEYIFKPKEYYQKSLISSLANQIKTVNREWKNICIKTNEFIPFKEYFEIVKISKKLSLNTTRTPLTDNFVNACYYEFGALVSVKGESEYLKCDVFLDLEKIDTNGRLMINVNGKDFLLYPDTSYFSDNEEYQKLLPYNIEHNIICAAFSNK